MSVEQQIVSKLDARFGLDHLDVVNESGNHNVPANSETHFKEVMVAKEFEGKRLIARHRMVHEVLAEELQRPVHALALHTYTDAEWKDRFGDVPMSPPCVGGGSD